MKFKHLLSLISMVVLAFHSEALAATNTVTTLADSGAGSLRQLIASSASGDTISIPLGGTIVLTSGELAITHDLSIIGPGATNLAVSGNNTFVYSNVFSPIYRLLDSARAIQPKWQLYREPGKGKTNPRDS